jgi:hypothetical protein
VYLTLLRLPQQMHMEQVQPVRLVVASQHGLYLVHQQLVLLPLLDLLLLRLLLLRQLRMAELQLQVILLYQVQVVLQVH